MSKTTKVIPRERSDRGISTLKFRYKLKKHPDKTFIGKIKKGFDLLGYKYEPSGLSLAPKALERFADHIARLYEQGADELRIGQYAKHFTKWANAGVSVNIGDSLRLYLTSAIKYHSCQTGTQ